MPEELSVINAIQLILAPAVMISACGLLMLGINAKFSTVLARIRTLNEEKRRLTGTKAAGKRMRQVEMRLVSVNRQLDQLLRRGRFVRNSLLSYILGVALFVCTSLLIGFGYFLQPFDVRFVVLATFLAGMLAVVMGIVFAALDTKIAYDVVSMEVRNGK